MTRPRVRLGDMLVGAGLIDERQLAQALDSQRTSGRRLGEELVHLGFLSEVQMTQVLSNQLSIPWVSLYHVEFSRDLLNLVPAELAEDFVLIPVYVRRVRNEGEVLFVAMDDPTNEELLARINEVTGMSVKPMVAPPAEILKAIQIYYFSDKPRIDASFSSAQMTEPAPPRRSLEPPKVVIVEPGKPDAHEARTRPAPPPETAPRPLAGKEDVPGKELPARHTGGAKPSMITLTLLDGTKVNLPTPGVSGRVTQRESLTATDLIAALRARALGKDTSSVLPDANWESLFASLLSVLIRKGLVADWEFVDELARHTKTPT